MTFNEAFRIAIDGWTSDKNQIGMRTTEYKTAIYILYSHDIDVEISEPYNTISQGNSTWHKPYRDLAFNCWNTIDYRITLPDGFMDMGV